MAYHVELKGTPLSSKQSDTSAYVLQGSVSIETAIAERPTAALAVRVPKGVTLAPKDFDELTIDYPALPYRAWAERHADLLSYWRLDEAAVTMAADSTGATPLAYSGGNNLQYRAFRQETSAVPYGGAPEWEHTSGDGLLGILGAGIDPTFTIAGFVRLQTGAFGDRYIWRANGNNRSLLLSADGSMELQPIRADAQRRGRRDHGGHLAPCGRRAERNAGSVSGWTGSRWTVACEGFRDP